MNFARTLLVVALACAASTVVAADPDWQTSLKFADRSATAKTEKNGYRLDSNGHARTIATQPLRSETASSIVDALFALAQAEAAEARTKQLTDGAYNHGKPIPCDCFVTGVKWPFVWTRDSAYSIDLALGWLDPARARRTLEFKLSDVREPSAPQGLYVVQDTGSGGSWPISTDRVVWFLGARGLLDDKAFADETYKALKDTLAQDRQYAFDAQSGLYRGETSFLDWREQTYPVWTEKNVRFIAESFALSTNVLHYEALRLAVKMAKSRNDSATAGQYQGEAAALRAAIDTHFWREDRGLYMSYIGAADGPQTIEAYDLLGTALAILADIPAPERARKALANYPTWPAGSPVIWPEHRDAAIYHNRAIWPFVSAYALHAARKLDDANRIAHELRSILQGAALSGSNYENYELVSGAVHVEDGKWSGPVVNSPRQLWSVAAMLDAIVQGVFGVDGDKVEPKIPVELVTMLFGERGDIRLHLPGREITLAKPVQLDKEDNLLVAGGTKRDGKNIRVILRGTKVASSSLKLSAPEFAPDTPEIIPTAPKIVDGSHAPVRFWLDNKLAQTWKPGGEQALKSIEIADTTALQSLWTTRVDPSTLLESLPGPIVRLGQFDDVGGAWPRAWTAKHDGRYQLRLGYENKHGPINTGVTAAVKMLAIDCEGAAKQSAPIVMPHSVAKDFSTAAAFEAKAGKKCTFSLGQGFNMSFLSRNKLYTGEQGGESGPLNEADYGELRIVPLK
ncbi:MGH1-like glycoside hydrolase domain-containing protein [Rudaea sp.]|uniref:alpha-L-rhamnosidase-related protein n=1 Tax=Rudaea sp. TaxID=2136325 RepID=UPI002ED60026